MYISTKGRYALRVMLDLAEHGGRDFAASREIAARQGISLKYLERILAGLSRAGLISAMPGRGGGYRLNRPAGDYTVAEILLQAGQSLSPVKCLRKNSPCGRSAHCLTRPLWKRFEDLAADFFNSITLADLLGGQKGAAGLSRRLEP